jgi:hypothetical protein
LNSFFSELLRRTVPRLAAPYLDGAHRGAFMELAEARVLAMHGRRSDDFCF